MKTVSYEKRFKIDLLWPIVILIIPFAVHLIKVLNDYNLTQFGIFPRHIKGLSGILFSPFIHGSWDHLLANSFSFWILLFFLIHFYRKIAFKSVVYIFVISQVLLWCFGREYWHIGLSGVVYGIAFEVCLLGIFSKQINLSAVSLAVVFLYGSFIWGMTPINPEISWEGHLFGATAGILMSIIYRRLYKKPKPVIEPSVDDEHYIKYSYKPPRETFFDKLMRLPDRFSKKNNEKSR
ncbi:MAG: rhomboid family intramembrane serine protease [Bacteroidales bacterium]|nr:rhomboid family intramembrane serine protease [Bacteroidales bacterium]